MQIETFKDLEGTRNNSHHMVLRLKRNALTSPPLLGVNKSYSKYTVFSSNTIHCKDIKNTAEDTAMLTINRSFALL